LQLPELIPEDARTTPGFISELPTHSFIQRGFKMYRRAREDTLPGFAWTDVLECHKLPEKLTKISVSYSCHCSQPGSGATPHCPATKLSL